MSAFNRDLDEKSTRFSAKESKRAQVSSRRLSCTRAVGRDVSAAAPAVPVLFANKVSHVGGLAKQNSG